MTGWIKYIGPGGADALLLTGGQEADGWTTQLTGRAALDGVQSRHRMLRRVRLVRGPAVVTVLAQEARPGDWQLRGARLRRVSGLACATCAASPQHDWVDSGPARC